MPRWPGRADIGTIVLALSVASHIGAKTTTGAPTTEPVVRRVRVWSRGLSRFGTFSGHVSNRTTVVTSDWRLGGTVW